MLVAGSITFLVIADIIVKPVSRLTKATNELSKGNYRVRVNYAGTDEIAKLNRSFNLMAQQLAKQEEIR
jgi:nitrogen fixation/metabolism regulation signal transduction histidine kinase